jgi:tetratricopeptide (TPR) repeat protein
MQLKKRRQNMITPQMKGILILIALILGSIHPICSTDPVCSTDPPCSTDSIKVLVDESRIQEAIELEQWVIDAMKALGFEFKKIEDPRCSFENTKEGFGFGTAAARVREECSLNIKKSGQLSYSTLRNYDVLVIMSFSESYSFKEAEAIRQFVENGGGLFFAAYCGSPNDSVSTAFDVTFPSDTNILDERDKSASRFKIYVNDLESHPITEGIDQILLDYGVPISSFEYGEVLARTSETSWKNSSSITAPPEEDTGKKNGPFDVVLAQSVGEGRTVFFGGSDSFCNSTEEEEDQQNLDFLVNAIRWLGEPGGPYKQYKTKNQQAQQLMSDAKSLVDNHKFSLAKPKFEDVIALYTESEEIFANLEAEQGIPEAESFVQLCENGMKADTLFDEALGLYQERKLEDAGSKFESAQSLYEEIGYEARVTECVSWITECQRLVDVREEALSLFSEGQNTLKEGSSAVSAAGYEKAKSLFEQAKSKWEEYGDEVKASECDEKIGECDKGISVVNRNRIVLGCVSVAIILAGVVMVLWRRGKPQSG